MIDGVVVTPLKIIDVSGGDVLHAIKADDNGYSGFGEAYFSIVDPGKIKAWKRHREMTLNIIVPIGKIKFVIFDDRDADNATFQEVVLSKSRYFRLTVPPMVWVGFQGLSKEPSMLLNVANYSHDPLEVDREEVSSIAYKWDSQ